LTFGLGRDNFKQLTHLTPEEGAQTFNSREIDPRGGFVVQRSDRTAVQAGTFRNIRDAKFVPTHERRQVATDHFVCCALIGVMRRITKICAARNSLSEIKFFLSNLMPWIGASQTFYGCSRLNPHDPEIRNAIFTKRLQNPTNRDHTY